LSNGKPDGPLDDDDMVRTFRPILDAAAGTALVMIATFQDRPCPSRAEIAEWTGVPRRRIAGFLADLVSRGIIEIETKGRPPALSRRMRAPGGSWTDWSDRGGPQLRPSSGAAANLLAMIAAHNDRPCPNLIEIAKWAGVPRRRIEAFLDDLAAQGTIEIEVTGRRKKRRRMRAPGGSWTGWTRSGASR
jgi:DNA-binding IscR family transcriptional regulator